MDNLTRIRRIRSHTGLARFIAQLSDDPVAYIARSQVSAIPSPYRYSPTVQVWDWNGRKVAWFETSHRCYDVYEVPSTASLFETEEAATEFEIAAEVERRR
jgi:hypothetical protein